MANYSLTINSKFKPFSYQELLAPVHASTEAQQSLETQYGELAAKAEAWKNAAMSDPNPEVGNMYKRFAEDLNTRSKELAANGLNASSRQSMLDMYKRYFSDIDPIEKAYNRKKELIDERRKLIASDPTLMFEQDPSTMSLKTFIDNPTADYGNSYSGAFLRKEVADQASRLANILSSYRNGDKLDEFTKTFVKRFGASERDVIGAMQALNPNSSEYSKALSFIKESVLKSSGILNWADNSTLLRANDFLNEGLWASIGKSDVTPYEDKRAMYDEQLKLAKIKKGIGSGEQTSTNAPTPRTRNILIPLKSGGYGNTVAHDVATKGSADTTIKDMTGNLSKSVAGLDRKGIATMIVPTNTAGIATGKNIDKNDLSYISNPDNIYSIEITPESIIEGGFLVTYNTDKVEKANISNARHALVKASLYGSKINNVMNEKLFEIEGTPLSASEALQIYINALDNITDEKTREVIKEEIYFITNTIASTVQTYINTSNPTRKSSTMPSREAAEYESIIKGEYYPDPDID